MLPGGRPVPPAQRCRYSSVYCLTGRPRRGYQFFGRCFGGMQGRMPRLCSDWRNFRLSSPLSAISCRGRDFGLPFFCGAEIVASIAAIRTSPIPALVVNIPSGRPFASVASMRRLPFPLPFRPTASPPFLAGTNEPSSKAADQSIASSAPACQGACGGYVARRLPLASAASVDGRSSRRRTSLAYCPEGARATRSRCAARRGWR